MSDFVETWPALTVGGWIMQAWGPKLVGKVAGYFDTTPSASSSVH